MKKIVLFLFTYFLITNVQAAAIALSEMPEGLKHGSFELILKHAHGYYFASGEVINEYDHRYDFAPSLNEVNRTLNDSSTVNPVVALTLRCANGAWEMHQFNSEQLTKPETILVNPPANCTTGN